MKEADLKRCIRDYLQYQMNLGNLYYDFLNSGDLIVLNHNGTHRRIKLCRPGTADLYVLRNGKLLFVEVKREGGKQSKEQKAFEAMAIKNGAEYKVVRSLEDLERALCLLGKRCY